MKGSFSASLFRNHIPEEIIMGGGFPRAFFLVTPSPMRCKETRAHPSLLLSLTRAPVCLCGTYALCSRVYSAGSTYQQNRSISVSVPSVANMVSSSAALKSDDLLVRAKERCSRGGWKPKPRQSAGVGGTGNRQGTRLCCYLSILYPLIGNPTRFFAMPSSCCTDFPVDGVP